jgi:c-di-GMP-binding flagellar brake protein YcgR
MQAARTDIDAGGRDGAGDGLTRRDAFRARVWAIAGLYVLSPETATPGWRSAWLRDVSASGAGLEVPALHAAEGDDVLIRFAPRGDTTAVQLRGRIVRRQHSTARDAYGVRFVNLTMQQSELLHALVARMTVARRAARN